MIGMKQITQYVPVDIDITGITLLSIDEYEATKKNIPPLDALDEWWLRSPGNLSRRAACVRPHGVDDLGRYVESHYIGVRPALRINPKSANLQIREKIRLGGFIWTYVSEGTLLCDSIITYMPFREDWRAKDSNEYEASDVKKFLEKWFATVNKDNGVPVTVEK